MCLLLRPYKVKTASQALPTEHIIMFIVNSYGVLKRKESPTGRRHLLFANY